MIVQDSGQESGANAEFRFEYSVSGDFVNTTKLSSDILTCIRANQDGDIVQIVAKVKEVLGDLEEKKLFVELKGTYSINGLQHCYSQSALYRDGKLRSCSLIDNEWNNVVEAIIGENGAIEFRYKRFSGSALSDAHNIVFALECKLRALMNLGSQECKKNSR